MKFFSRLFSDKDANAASDGSDPESVAQSEGPTPPSPPLPSPPPVPTPAIASCDSRPIDISTVEKRTVSAPPIVPPPLPRSEPRAGTGTPTRTRARTPATVTSARKNQVTTVTMPPTPAAAPTPKRVDADKPSFSAPGITLGTKVPSTAPPSTAATPITPVAKPIVATPTAKPATVSAVVPSTRRRRTRPTIDKPADSAELFSEIDAAIDGTVEVESKPAAEGKLANDAKTEQEIRVLFGRIAAQHVAPVRDFVIELGLAPTAKSWLAISRPAVASLRRAGERIHFTTLVAAADAFASALAEAERSPGGFVEGMERDAILMRYRDLEAVLPEAFDVAPTQNRREPIVVHALLAKVAGLGSLGVHKLYSAGITNLASLYRARVDDLVSTTGIEAPVCAAIVDEVQRYRRSRAEQAPEPDHARERGRLREIIDALSDCESRFRAADAAEDRSAKRRIRRQRDLLIHELDLVLAHLGELDLVSEMAQVSIAGRIRRVDGWLRQPPARASQNRAHA